MLEYNYVNHPDKIQYLEKLLIKKENPTLI
jgi:hypothetical protein